MFVINWALKTRIYKNLLLKTFNSEMFKSEIPGVVQRMFSTDLVASISTYNHVENRKNAPDFLNFKRDENSMKYWVIKKKKNAKPDGRQSIECPTGKINWKKYYQLFERTWSLNKIKKTFNITITVTSKSWIFFKFPKLSIFLIYRMYHMEA